VQEAGQQCQHPGCAVLVVWRGTGKEPRFCGEHQGGKYAKQRQRLKDKEPSAPKPPCCVRAGRQGGRLACEQHKQGQSGAFPEKAWAEIDYHGAPPKPKHTNRPKPDATGTDRTIANARLWVFGQWTKERYSHNGQFIRVIGQRDVTADWTPIPGESPPRGLVARGPDWPWVEEEPMAVAA
jgi:hypothetical protein